ncbi:MAG TPA: hypothetical protein VFA47_10765 [Candidatus Manganitrophaceae bacterium]|nr:hypothetical protein [Candidatus Manganitrophaceae bacterium]
MQDCLFTFGLNQDSEQSIAEKDHNDGENNDIGGEDLEDGGAVLKKFIADIDEARPPTMQPMVKRIMIIFLCCGVTFMADAR